MLSIAMPADRSNRSKFDSVEVSLFRPIQHLSPLPSRSPHNLASNRAALTLLAGEAWGRLDGLVPQNGY